MNSSAPVHGWNESTRSRPAVSADRDSMFQQMFERSADAMFLVDARREIFIDCNRAAIEMMRASSKEQLLMVNPAELSPEVQPDGKSSRERISEDIHLALSKGSHRFDWRSRRMDGTEFPVEVLLTPIQAGEQALVAATCRDITERKAAEAALRESEQKFRGLFEGGSDAVQILDPVARRIVDCNIATVRMAGGDKEWFLSQPIDSLSPERQPDGRLSKEVGRMWAQRALTEGPQQFEWTGLRRNGELFPVEVLLTPVQLDGRVMLVSVSREISERKKNERELRELNQSLERRVAERTAALTASEARFRVLVEHAPEAIVVYSVDEGRFLFGNQHACDLYGVPMSKLPELTPEQVSPEFQPCGRRTSELVQEKTNEVLAGGISVFEWLHQQPNGRLIPTDVRLLRLPAEGQTLIRASIIDNTERKAAELALRESEEKFRALFERTSQGIVLHDEEQILEVNPAAVRILGRRSAAELVGRHPSETSPPRQRNGENSDAMARQYIQECMTGGSARFEWMSCTPQGVEIPLEVTLSRIQWSGRQVIQALVNDISERKKAEAELQASETRLRESEARFSAAFHASPIVTAVSRSRDGRFVLANDAFLNWAGYERDEVLGRTALELGIWESAAERTGFWEEVRLVGWVRARECRLRNRRGKYSTMLASGVVISFNGEDHLLGIMLDITQRKLAEAELHRTVAREMELSQLKSNFVSMVSHEFRTPLGIIQSSAELLRDFHERMQPDERSEQLESIAGNTRRMAAMMEEILILSRLDAGKLEFQPATLALDAFCRRVVDEVLSATNRRCQIELSLRAIPSQVEADERLLGHIFTNLLSNAVKYSEPRATVQFSVERDGRYALCVVRDHGIGIPDDDLQQLFKAFHRGSNVGPRAGTGLGLLLVKRCAELHRGDVHVSSQLAQGTTVTVKLPLFATNHEEDPGH